MHSRASVIMAVSIAMLCITAQVSAQTYLTVTNIFSDTTCGSFSMLSVTSSSTACAAASSACAAAGTKSSSSSCAAGTLSQGKYQALLGTGTGYTGSVILDAYSAADCAAASWTGASVLPFGVCLPQSGSNSALKLTYVAAGNVKMEQFNDAACATTSTSNQLPLTPGTPSGCNSKVIYTIAGAPKNTTVACFNDPSGAGCKSLPTSAASSQAISLAVSIMAAVIAVFISL
jgi:hypothetical protein